MGNDVSKDIKNIFVQAQEHIKKYLKVKDDILENEYIQLVGDISKVVKFIRGANELIINKKFNAFLSGFTDNEKPTEEQIKKLIEYIDDESKAEFISDTFSKVLLSNSSKACLIMGTLLKSIISEGGELDHDKLICISALTNFFDVDLHNFKILFDFYEWDIEHRNLRPRKKYENFMLNSSLKKYLKKKKINYSSFILTIEKSVSHQLIIRKYEADISADLNIDFESVDIDQSDIDEYYSINSAGQLLYSYIKRISL